MTLCAACWTEAATTISGTASSASACASRCTSLMFIQLIAPTPAKMSSRTPNARVSFPPIFILFNICGFLPFFMVFRTDSPSFTGSSSGRRRRKSLAIALFTGVSMRGIGGRRITEIDSLATVKIYS